MEPSGRLNGLVILLAEGKIENKRKKCPFAAPLLAKYPYHLGLRKILTDDILDPTRTQKSAKISRRRFRKRRIAAGLPRHGHPRRERGQSPFLRLQTVRIS